MNSRYAAVALTLTFILCSLASAAAPGKLTVEPPTLHCAGFHWEVSGAGDKTTAQIRFRKVGQGEWQKGMDFMQIDLEKKTYLAGSIFGLQPGTEYEAQLTLVDPAGVEGDAPRTVTFTTRTAPKMPKGGKTYHVYPEGHSGNKLQPLLGEGNWRKALADPSSSPLQAGDIVRLHGGQYTLSANIQAVRALPVDKVSTAAKPQMPQGGTTWHVYPPDHKGKKQKPTVRLNHYQTPILNLDRRSGEQIVQPGDTVLFHGGTYKVNKYNYRDRLFQGPKWGVWWFRRGGTPGKPVLFKAAGDGEVIFDGAGNMAIFEVAATRHLWIDGLTFRNAQCGLIAGHDGWDTAEGLTVTNCKFDQVAMPIYADTTVKGLHLSGNEGLAGVHAGPWYEAFGTIDVNVKGRPGKPIVIQGDEDVMIEGGDRYAVFDATHADHVWIRDIKMKNTECVVLTCLYPFGHAPDGLIVTGLDGENVRMGVYGDESTGKNWYIADNRFIGRGVGMMSMNQHVSPFGINVCGQGHVVAYNHLEWFQDGIDLGWWDRDTSYERDDYTSSADVYGNFVFGSGDNSLEADGSYFNGRFFENAFLTNNSPSTQSTPGGPYYFIRNVFYNGRTDTTFKLPSSIIAVNNLFDSNLSLGRHSSSNSRFVNNLFMFAPGRSRFRRGKPHMVQMPAPRQGGMSDYNGLRMAREALSEKPFVQGKKAFVTLEAYAEATGQETHSILVPGYEELFVSVPEPQREDMYRLDGLDFRLKDGTVAIDAGAIVPNVSDSYNAKAPDLGPIEHGKPIPHYGPREKKQPDKDTE